MLAHALTEVEWWPSWWQAACAVVATGPSAKTAGVEKLRGRVKVIAIKEAAVDLCPWADVAYGCDAPWWRHRRGLPDFQGLKIGWDPEIPFANVHRIQIQKDSKGVYLNTMLFGQPGLIGGGLNSGFQAVNLAVQFGARRILLVGFDLHGAHYYGRNEWLKAGNPDKGTFESCIKIWNDTAPLLREVGVEVVNANSQSALKAFPKHSIDDTLGMWGL